jgi:hypothetical protein
MVLMVAGRASPRSAIQRTRFAWNAASQSWFTVPGDGMPRSTVTTPTAIPATTPSAVKACARHDHPGRAGGAASASGRRRRVNRATAQVTANPAADTRSAHSATEGSVHRIPAPPSNGMPRATIPNVRTGAAAPSVQPRRPIAAPKTAPGSQNAARTSSKPILPPNFRGDPSRERREPR